MNFSVLIWFLQWSKTRQRPASSPSPSLHSMQFSSTYDQVLHYNVLQTVFSSFLTPCLFAKEFISYLLGFPPCASSIAPTVLSYSVTCFSPRARTAFVMAHDVLCCITLDTIFSKCHKAGLRQDFRTMSILFVSGKNTLTTVIPALPPLLLFQN